MFMRKLIDIPDEILKPLKILAIKEETDLKTIFKIFYSSLGKAK